MKKILLPLIYVLAVSTLFLNTPMASAQKGGTPKGWSAGLRLGDPLGLTFKKHFGGNKAIEFNIGSSNATRWNGNYYTGNKYYNEWYDDRYYKYGRPKDWKGYYYGDGYDYGYRLSNAISFQAHYLMHKDIKALSGLRWYVGVGPQVQFITFENYYNDFGRQMKENHTFINLGIDGTGGLEYNFSDVPLTVFLDLTLYLEIYRSPFRFQPQGGIGCRYNF